MRNSLLTIIYLFSVAQCFTQTWSALGTGTNEIVHHLYADEVNNRLYLGGAFTSPQNGICFWDGTNYNPMGSGIQGTVRSIVKFGNEIIAAGEFSNAGGVSVSNVAKWDGSAWSTMGNGLSGMSSYVTSLVIYNNELYASGNFSNPTGRVAKWSGTDWISINANADGVVREMEVFQGSLILAGGFSSIGGISASRIAKYNGSAFSILSNDIYDDIINQNGMASIGNELIVAGLFTNIGSTLYNRATIWDGTQYSNLTTGLNAGALCAGVYNNEFVVGGGFSDAGGVSVSNISTWNGTNWEAMGQGLNDFPYTMTELNGDLYVGGAFTIVDGTITANRIAKWSNNSSNVTEIIQSEFRIYPNPAKTNLNIDSKSSNFFSVKIFDSNGTIAISEENKKDIDISNLNSGIYFLVIENQEEIKRFKLIKN